MIVQNNCSYDVHAKSILEGHITGIAISIAITHSKIILKNKYNIAVVQDKPLILSTSVPLNKIDENF